MGQLFADWAERMLLGIDEFIVPVKKLWNVHCEESEIPQITPEELSQVLKSDPRFYYIEETEDEGNETEDERLRFEKMGFFKGPKVMLQGKIPSKQELIDSITRNIDKMMLNLRKAYEIRPKDNDRTEDELIDVMLKADQLKKEILKVMREDLLIVDDLPNAPANEGDAKEKPPPQKL